MSQVQGFNQSTTGGSGILTINSNPPNGGGDYGLSGINGINVTQGVAYSVISTPSGAFSFNEVAGTSQAMVAGNAYILTNTSLTTVSLPDNASTNVGDTFKVIGLSGGYLISQAADQQIIIGSDQSMIGASGYAQCSGALFNAITLTCVSTAGAVYVWAAIDPPQGIFTVN